MRFLVLSLLLWPTVVACDSDSSSTTGDGQPPTAPAADDPDCVPDTACQPELLPSTGDAHDDCVVRVNQFRDCMCLPRLTRNRDAEDCADQQAAYDVSNGPHGGFRDGICAPRGNAQNECPGWGSSIDGVIDGCIQMMFDEGPPAEEPCDGACYQAHGHFINMTGDYTSVACGIHDAGGDLRVVQNFF